MKKFDLNIEKILENWDLKHAVREIIANAIDEQILSGTNDISITKGENSEWHIRDFGRGIRYEHFTQKENEQKLSTDGIIGKFGIGLKDALATFERKTVSVKILSKHGDITLGKSQKSGFDDLITLHAYIDEPSQPDMVGTDFVLSNIDDADIEDGKQLFLRFKNEQVIETVRHGQVLMKSSKQGNIYINGVLVASEENFLFSYNITLLNAAIRKAINRERANVGRTAYATTVKNILLDCGSKEIANLLTNDLRQFSYGNTHDELKWLDVQQHAATILNKYQKVVFVTAEEIENGNDLVEQARRGNFEVISIPTNLRDKLVEQNRQEIEKQLENPEEPVELIRTFNQYAHERSENFEFEFIPKEALTHLENLNFGKAYSLIEMVGGMPNCVKEVLVSETMQRDAYTFMPVAGLWMPSKGRIIIKRSVLSDFGYFAGVLLHEVAHAKSGAIDGTRAFETQLTEFLGQLSIHMASNNHVNIDSMPKVSPASVPEISTLQELTSTSLDSDEVDVKHSNLDNVDGHLEKQGKGSIWKKLFGK
jgi:hypothetical protein